MYCILQPTMLCIHTICNQIYSKITLHFLIRIQETNQFNFQVPKKFIQDKADFNNQKIICNVPSSFKDIKEQNFFYSNFLSSSLSVSSF